MSRTEAHITDELQAATSAGNLDKITKLLNEWDTLTKGVPFSPIEDLLPLAARNGDTRTISYLLQRRKPASFKDAILTAFDTPNVDTAVFQAFLDGGFNINTNLGHIGDLLILSLGYPDVLKWALAHGADPNRNRTGMRSPLDLAVMRASPEAVLLLLRHGARLNNTNALKAAAFYGELGMIKLLLEAGALINEIPDCEGMLSSEREDGLGTALHEAANGGQKEAAELLLERGADPAIKNSLRKTALDIAKEKGNAAVVEVLESIMA
ncbi:hypothetical protein D9615_000787 [Tricholomella constricta]|uniref:Uncharacterized protein n=1 Tax=Tricholomella constricta TaxID=117010 RepID=A0A8H5HRK2_9AGAR|nr:hypothetical protein D9615_000787 [Tricholomella constricta]